MESQCFHNSRLAIHILRQMAEACSLVLEWNKSTFSVNDFVTSSQGMQRLAASCMLIESVGEGVKKIDRLIPGFLDSHYPDIPWKSLKGMRDHIAHGYFSIDAELVFDVVSSEMEPLKDVFLQLISVLENAT